MQQRAYKYGITSKDKVNAIKLKISQSLSNIRPISSPPDRNLATPFPSIDLGSNLPIRYNTSDEHTQDYQSGE
jgi:hypothetical protein